jgi:hypothetical protein
MKVTVEIDCTPAEARQFFGLPNVEPMQAAMMTNWKRGCRRRWTVSPLRLL